MKGYYELLNMDKVKELEKTAYRNGKIDILKTIEDKMSVGIDMLDIIKQEKLKLEKQIDFQFNIEKEYNMATLNMDGFSDEFRETAPMECACYLF